MPCVPRVLLCDAAFSALPLLFALRQRGMQVSVCGARPEDPGHRLADSSHLIDYSDRAALLALARELQVDYLVPGCTDVSYLACASVARQLGLPGYDAADALEVIFFKEKFRAFCMQQGFPVPALVADPHDPSSWPFPVLVKPSDAFSGRGIVKVLDARQAPAALAEARAASASGRLAIEAFVEGDLFSHSAFIRQGQLTGDVFVSEFCTVNPWQVNSSCLATRLPESVQLQMRSWLAAFAQALQLVDGLVHTQFILSPEGLRLIEVTRRCPGDLYSQLVSDATGIDYADAFIAPFCGAAVPPAALVARSPLRPLSRHTVSVHEDCIFLQLGVQHPCADHRLVPLKRTGERLLAAPRDRAGIYFVCHPDEGAMTRETPGFRRHIQLQTSPWR